MVIEGLGVQEEPMDAHMGVLARVFRLSRYSMPPNAETGVSRVPIQADRNDNVITMIIQHEVEGLKVTRTGAGLACRPITIGRPSASWPAREVHCKTRALLLRSYC